MSVVELIPPCAIVGPGGGRTSHLATVQSGLSGTGGLAAALAHMLDEVDYGLVLVSTHGALRHANKLARAGLRGPGPVCAEGGRVFAPREADQALLQQALADAGRGLRRLLTLGQGAQSVSLAVLPLDSGDTACPGTSSGEAQQVGPHGTLVMLVFGKQPQAQTLTLDFYARAQRLTQAEVTVLHALCAGHRPKEIASQIGVAISTVRTQIGSIRVKTQTRSIRDLTNKVANLPPITSAMQVNFCH